MYRFLVNFIFSLLFLSLFLNTSDAKTLKVDQVEPSVTNGDLTLIPNGTGDLVLDNLTGVPRLTGGVLSVSAIDLTTDVSGILPVANGGTGSATQNYVDLTTIQSIGGAKTFSAAISFALDITMTGTGSIKVPVGTDAQRPTPAQGMLRYNTDQSSFEGYNGTTWGNLASGGTTVAQIAYVKDVKATTVAGGGCTSGSWNQRDINTVEGDATIVSVSSNQFTLPLAGLYSIEVNAPANASNLNQARLYDVTNTAVVKYGGNADATGGGSTSKIYAEVDIASSTTYKIEHQCSLTNGTTGFGRNNSFGGDEVYTQIKIIKIE